jgi:glycosyltransferase involved in cell wall biosynthesis
VATVYRIVYVIPTLELGGAEKQLTLLATSLPRSLFFPQVVVLTRTGPYEQELRDAGIPVTVLQKRLKLDPVCLYRLSRLLWQLRPELVHTWLFAGNSYGRLAARLTRVRRLVATERCADWWKGAAQLWVDRLLARVTDRIIVNSRGVYDFYRCRGIPAEKLVIIPNGVPLGELPFVNRRAFLHELGLPPDAQVVGFVGRLWPQKRVEDLLWACDIVRHVKPQLRVLVIGDGPLRESLQDYARAIQVADRTLFLGQRSDIDRLLQVVDVLVLPSAYEGMPNAILEAMWAGVPVVATNIPGTNELVVDGVTGYLVPVGDRAALARRIHQLLDNPALRSSLGQAARERVRQHFSVARMVEAHVALYRELLERGTRGEPVLGRATTEKGAQLLRPLTRPLPASTIRTAACL